MLRPHPVSIVEIGAYWLIVLAGAAALLTAYVRHREKGDATRRSRLSTLGIAIQGIGFVCVGIGPVDGHLPWWDTGSLVGAAVMLALGASAIGIFLAATSAMGKNWSVVARMRSDHQLVRTGPFRVVRHPIYLALLLFLPSLAVAFGHYAQLVAAVPFYIIGTMVRVREEEKLLRAQFGDDHARYVREVPAFIPFLR